MLSNCGAWEDSWEFLGQQGFPGGPGGKEYACNAGEPRGWSLAWEDPLEREWLSTPVLLPGGSHGQRSLVGYSRVKHNWVTNTFTFTMTLIHSTGLQKLQESHMFMNDRSILFNRGKLPFLSLPLISYFNLRMWDWCSFPSGNLIQKGNSDSTNTCLN